MNLAEAAAHRTFTTSLPLPCQLLHAVALEYRKRIPASDLPRKSDVIRFCTAAEFVWAVLTYFPSLARSRSLSLGRLGCGEERWRAQARLLVRGVQRQPCIVCTCVECSRACVTVP